MCKFTTEPSDNLKALKSTCLYFTSRFYAIHQAIICERGSLSLSLLTSQSCRTFFPFFFFFFFQRRGGGGGGRDVDDDEEDDDDDDDDATVKLARESLPARGFGSFFVSYCVVALRTTLSTNASDFSFLFLFLFLLFFKRSVRRGFVLSGRVFYPAFSRAEHV